MKQSPSMEQLYPGITGSRVLLHKLSVETILIYCYGSKDSYHSQVLPGKVRQNLWTLTLSGKECLPIQPYVLKLMCFCIFIWLTYKFGYKCDQFHAGTGGTTSFTEETIYGPASWMCS